MCLKGQESLPLYNVLNLNRWILFLEKTLLSAITLLFLFLISHKIKECRNSHLKCLKWESKYNTLLHEENKGKNA